MTINIEIAGNSEDYVQERRSSSEYADADDVVRNAFLLMEARGRAEARQAIEAGWQDIQAGRSDDGETFMQALMADLEDEPS